MSRSCVFFFNDTATTEIYTLSLHDALPIYAVLRREGGVQPVRAAVRVPVQLGSRPRELRQGLRERLERALVRRELDHALEPELALDLLDRLPGLVRDEVVEARPDQPRWNGVAQGAPSRRATSA